ncbi:hypothetical protein GPA10_29150 [Streptomyces sp. p1417]|uniref:OmpR/PhoB-type domain-containing protein n=1 Tax=Streptomyces typhae TaxID=2681492 RepID=A0A6L6X4E4_9ACTN|nr:hypothetical protein [Streptomyces typhae]
MAVRFTLLGDIEVLLDGRPLAVGHLRKRGVLAALVVDAPRVVPVDRLADRVWADRPPQRFRSTLYSYLSRLRQALAAVEEHGVHIGREPGGYRLTVDRSTVDLHRFRDLAAQARAARDAQDGERAAGLFQRALGRGRRRPSPVGTRPGSTNCATPSPANASPRNSTARTSRCGRDATANSWPRSRRAPPRTRWTSGSRASSCSPCTARDGRPTPWRTTGTSGNTSPRNSAWTRPAPCGTCTSSCSPEIPAPPRRDGVPGRLAHRPDRRRTPRRRPFPPGRSPTGATATPAH